MPFILPELFFELVTVVVSYLLISRIQITTLKIIPTNHFIQAGKLEWILKQSIQCWRIRPWKKKKKKCLSQIFSSGKLNSAFIYFIFILNQKKRQRAWYGMKNISPILSLKFKKGKFEVLLLFDRVSGSRFSFCLH